MRVPLAPGLVCFAGSMNAMVPHPRPQVLDEEATNKAQEEADKKAEEEGKEKMQVPQIMKTEHLEEQDWEVRRGTAAGLVPMDNNTNAA